VSQHEKFEAAWSAEYPLHSTTAFKRSGFNPAAYANTRVQDGLLMWQASHRAALEEAANHITRGVDDVKQNGWIDAANERLRCADAIRALAKDANNG
jgi:hypothetical protein